MEEFKHLNPKKLEYCLKGYKAKMEMVDREMWMWFGNYALSAVYVAVERNIAGKKARSEYIKGPILSKKQKAEKEYFTEKDIEMAVITEERYMAKARNAGLPETVIKF